MIFTTDKYGIYTKYLIYIITAVVLGFFLIHPFYDPDSYWHIKTGEWMWQNKALMPNDPFTIPPQSTALERLEFILTSYWLGQLIIYGFYAIAGLPGLVIFRLCTLILFLWAFSYWSKKSSVFTALSISIGLILLYFSGFPERPQFFSFIFFAYILIHFFSFLSTPDTWSQSRLTVPLFIVMLLWGNMHGGFTLAMAIMLLILGAETLKRFFAPLSSLSPQNFLKLSIAVIIALFAPLINPNPIISLKMLFQASQTNNYMYSTNYEYASIFEFIRLNHNSTPYLAIFLIIVTALFFATSKERKNITWFAILAVTAYMGCKHVRYMPFFHITSTLFTIKYFSENKPPMLGKIMICALFLVTIPMSLVEEPRNLKVIKKYGLIPGNNFPNSAANFILANNLKGNIFNDFDWGGFLIWKLGGHNKIFCDGRMLNPARYWEWLNALAMNSADGLYWKKLADKYDIQIIMLPFFGRNGESTALANSVKQDKDWMMVFAKDNTALFVRKTP